VDIVELNACLQEIVKKENQLRAEIDEIIKEIEGLQL
jgi:type I restriction-modification system DNA methylase subunit